MFWKVKALARDLVTPPVVYSQESQLFLESGDLERIRGANKIALVAAWSAQPEMSLSLSKYLVELERAGYVSLLISTSSFSQRLCWPYGLPESVVVVRRKNRGYDFGSWAAALYAFPQIYLADTVLLTNDSLLGPFSSLQEIFTEVEYSRADVIGLTDSIQMGHTIQSYFMVFKRGILADYSWRRFFNNIRPQRNKMDVVYRYEAAIASKCVREAYGWEVLYPATALKTGKTNPFISKWKELLQLGFPFVKRSLFTDPSLREHGEKACKFLAETYQVDVEQWMPNMQIASRKIDNHGNE